MGRGRHNVATAAQVLGPALAAAVGDLRAAERDVRLDSASGVHDFRIATRRLRSILRTARPLFGSEADTDLAPALRRAGQEASHTRDADVVRELVGRRLGEQPPGPVVVGLAQRLDSDLEERRRRQWAGLVEYLDADPYDQLVRRLDGFADLTPWSPRAAQPAADVLGPLIDREWHRFEARVEVVVRTPRDELADETLHDLRKQAKTVRYVGEVMKPSLGGTAKKVRKQLRAVHTLLGDLHDAQLAAAYLEQSAATVGEGPAERRILQRAHRQELAHAGRLRTEFLDGLGNRHALTAS